MWMNYGMGWWGMVLTWLIGIGLVVLLVALAIGLIAALARGSSGSANAPRVPTMPESPSEILRRRYASGEITREQFEQMKRDIEA
jgi:putative membrane protein